MKVEIVFKDGRKETFDSVESFKLRKEQTSNEECHTSVVALTPTEGMLFQVNPLEIDRSSFEKPMRDKKQEWTRKIIQGAFAEVDKQPEKYASTFYTLIPEKKWEDYKTIEELNVYANDLGGVMADWVEQALEWAQRIFNGESWEAVCNKIDTAKWYRMIVWHDGFFYHVGGSRGVDNYRPASDVFEGHCYSFERTRNTVPLVVIKKM